MAGSPLRVLVVDDNHDSAQSLCVLLTEWGYQCEAAYDGKTALLAAPFFRPTVILMDLNLPDMHGYDVAMQLRQELGDRRLFFVAITGWARIADQTLSSAAAISHHLVKPVNHDALRRILESYQSVEDAFNPPTA